MPDIWSMPRTAPAKPRQAKVDKLTEWDADTLREGMAASVMDSDKRKDRDINRYHEGSRRVSMIAPRVLDALTHPMTAAQLAGLLNVRRESVSNALTILKREGKVAQVEKVGYSILWGKVGE